jgi:hypothetical protein
MEVGQLDKAELSKFNIWVNTSNYFLEAEIHVLGR